jgi:hypothetical protein
MAQEVEVKIKVDTKDAVEGAKNLDKSLKEVGKQTDETGKHTKELQKGLLGSSKITGELSKATGGLSDVFIQSIRSIDLTKLSLKGLKGAIISTGIGALVVLVGELVSILVEFFTNTKGSEKALNSMTKEIEKQSEAFDKLSEENKFNQDMNMKLAKANGASKEELKKMNDKYLEGERKRIMEEIRLLALKRKEVINDSQFTEEDRAKALEEVDAHMKKLKGLEDKNKKEKISSDVDYKVEQIEAEKEKNEKLLQQQKEASDKAKQKREQANEKAKQQLEQEKGKLLALEKKYNEDIENMADKTEEEKLARQKQRALKELDEIKLSEEAKANARLLIEKDFQIKDEELKKAHNDKILELNQKLEDDKKTLQAKSDEEKLKLDQEKASAELEKQLAEINATETEKENARKLLKANFDLQNEELKTAKLEKEREEKIAMLELELEDDKISFETKKQLVKDREALLLEDKTLSESEKLRIHKEAVEAEKTIDKENYESKMALLGATSDLLSKASDAIGKETGVGKTLALASALMNTYQGISAGVKLGYPQAIPAVAMASLTGFGAVKNIMAVKVPKSGGGEKNSIGTPPPSAPSFNIVGNSGVNAIAETMARTGSSNKPVETFVVAQNVTSAQSLNRNIVSNATLG